MERKIEPRSHKKVGQKKPTIETISLAKRFITEKGNLLEVFRNINIKIKEGEFVTIIGPAGCGKSTLLKILGG